MNDALKNAIWNVISDRIVARAVAPNGMCTPDFEAFTNGFWDEVLHERVDTLADHPANRIDQLRDLYNVLEWNEVYDFIQWTARHFKGKLDSAFNAVLERELSGYRFVDSILVDVTNETELAEVRAAIEGGPHAGVRDHFRAAAENLSRRANPDLRNSIKESISAVEAMACVLAGKSGATLGDALKAIERGGGLHAALSKGFRSLYGYTSDADGIRHAMMDESTLSVADARYFLVSCSAFVNYLASKHKP